MPSTTIACDLRLPLAVITLIRPQSGNRIGLHLIEELREGVQALASDPAIRAIVLTGSDGVFSLGWDQEFLEQLVDNDDGPSAAAVLGWTFQFLADSRLPVIAAINGDAFSAGFELALACDVRVLAATAQVGLPDINLGRIPMAGGTQRLPRIAGPAVATEMILTGEPVEAGPALSRGLVNSVVEPEHLLSTATKLAEIMASRGPLALQFAKEAVHRGLDMTLEQGLRYETDLTVLLQTTGDRAEGVRAFLERQTPRFRGT